MGPQQETLAMNSPLPLLLAFGIGVIAGLRAMTAPAVTAWAALLGRLNLSGTALAFMGSKWTVVVFTLAALAELVTDQLPKTPPRTEPGPLVARIVMGGLSGACIAVAGVAHPYTRLRRAFKQVHALLDVTSKRAAMSRAAYWLERLAQRIAAGILLCT